MKMAARFVASMRVDSYDRADVVLERDAVAELDAVGGVPLARVYHFEASVREALQFRPGSVQKLRGSLRQLVDSPSGRAEPAAIARLARGVILGESETGEFNRPSVIDRRRPAERLLDHVAEWVNACFESSADSNAANGPPSLLRDKTKSVSS
jgi:hypothetical protein